MKSFEGGNGQILRRYILPQMLGLVCNSVYFIVDGLFIGNRLGALALAAAGVAVPVVEFSIAFSMFMATGAGIYIATRIGCGKRAEAKAAFNWALVVIGGVALCVMVLGCLFVRPLAGLLGATPATMGLVTEYLFVFLLFSPFLIFSFVLSTFARNNGCPGRAMAALMVGAGSNILLDWMFMYPLNMGMRGAALATGLGPVFSVLLLLPVFFDKNKALHYARPRRVKGLVKAAVQGGLPAFVVEFSIGLVALFYNLAVVRAGYGDDGLAARLVIGYAALIALTAFLGAAEGAQPAFAQFYGAGQRARAASLLRALAGFLVAVALCLYLLLFFFGGAFFSLFIRENAALVAFTLEKARMYFACLPFAAANILLVCWMQCTGRLASALAVSLSRSVVLVLAFLALLPLLLPQGLWWALTAAEVCSLLLAGLLVLASGRKKRVAGMA